MTGSTPATTSTSRRRRKLTPISGTVRNAGWGPERASEGTTSASPLLADGKLYITNELGITTVLAAGPEYKKLATNELDNSYTLSSIAVAGKQLFLRTATHLYCIAEADAAE